METYLPLFKSQLANWVQSTINDPLYAAALAIAVWLLTASLYSIIIASLKKKVVASENARNDMETQLNTAQQQMQQMQVELAANTEQMQKDQLWAQNESQRAAGLEEQLLLRNKQVAAIIQTLATSIDLGERPVPITEDIKAEGLWQQHDRVVTLLSSRLRSEQQAKTELQQAYQAETLKRTENEAVIATLQSSLAAQTVQVSQLELALDAQKVLQQQHQDQAQQILSQTLEKHLAELARLTELEQQLVKSDAKLSAKDALINQLEQAKPAEPVNVAPPVAIIAPEAQEPVIESAPAIEIIPPTPEVIEPQPISPAKSQLGKLKGLFGKSKPQALATEPEIATIQPAPLAVEPVAINPADTVKPDVEITQPEPLAIEPAPVSAAKGQLGKLKGLFGKTKQEPIPAEPEAIAAQQPAIEIQPEPLAVEPVAASAAKGQLGKLKNMFGSKQPVEAAEQEAAAIPFEPLEIKQPPVAPANARFGKIKHYFGEPKPAEEIQQEAEIQAEPVTEATPVSATKGQLGKLKNLFGKK